MKLNVSWEKLRLFYIVAKHGNITAAAHHINTSQPTLSRTITYLEKRLAVTLFHRYARGLTLTEKGLVLFNTLEQMMNNVVTAESVLLEMDKSPKGPLIIGSSAGIISLLLLDNAKTFLDAYPELELTVVLSDESPDFSTGAVEAAVFPYIPDQDNYLIQEYLMSSSLGLFASSEYLEKFGTPQSPQDLDHHRLIAYGMHKHPFSHLNWHLTICCPERVVRKPYIQVNLGAKVRSLIEQGVGIGALAHYPNTIRDPNKGLVHILPEVKGPDIHFYYIYPKHLEDSLRIKVLGDHFKSVIATQGLTKIKGKLTS